MTLRMEEQQHRRKEVGESGARHHLAKASSSSAAPASQDALAQPIIIECRKKNSKQESVVTHRFRKGKLLGKVRVGLSKDSNGNGKHAKSCFFFFWQQTKKWATAKKAAGKPFASHAGALTATILWYVARSLFYFTLLCAWPL